MPQFFGCGFLPGILEDHRSKPLGGDDRSELCAADVLDIGFLIGSWAVGATDGSGKAVGKPHFFPESSGKVWK